MRVGGTGQPTDGVGVGNPDWLLTSDAVMPELPEVETVRRGLEPALVGRTILDCEVRVPALRWPLPAGLSENLVGRTVEEVARRSKHLLVRLDDGTTLLIHLGMSGRLTIHPEPPTDASTAGGDGGGKHDHVVIRLDDGSSVVFTDARRFGSMDLVQTSAVAQHPRLRDLGPEPTDLDFGPVILADRLRNSRAPIKSALLDQRLIAGLGNIYVCEALHRAAISPRRRAGTIPGRVDRPPTIRVTRLATAISRVIEEAIEAGGSSLRDFAAVDGSLGYFTLRFAVYDREGADCPRADCAGLVKRFMQSGRSTFHCSMCQR